MDAEFVATLVEDQEYSDQAMDLVNESVSEEDVSRSLAVKSVFDLTIYYNGNVIEPTAPITVGIEFAKAIPENEQIYAVHFPGSGEQPQEENPDADSEQTDASTDSDQANPDTSADNEGTDNNLVQNTHTDDSANEGASDPAAELNTPTQEEGDPVVIETVIEENVSSFETETFSYYAIVSYTVDFHFGVDGKSYEFTLPGGGAVGMRELAPALGLAEDTDNAADLFVRSIKSIVFSDESLVRAIPVEMNMTVSALKQKWELETEYSSELTEAQITELNDKLLCAPDWALLSLKPFVTEETLTVFLQNGETFTIAVTDAQLTQTVISACGDTYTITVTYDENAEIPGDAELKVREILPRDAEYADYLEEAKKAASGEAYASEPDEYETTEEEGAGANGEGEYARFFDIEIWANDQKIEPADAVTVDIALTDAPQTEEELKVVHFDEKDGPVVMQTEAAEDSELVAAETASVRFETSSFSVYGVIVSPHTPKGIDDLNGQMCTISHSKNETKYLKSNILNEQVDKFDKTGNQSEAAVWQFESTGVASNYYISTIVDGVKKYMQLVSVDGNVTCAKGALSETPQEFSVNNAGNGLYRISTTIGSNTYYLNEFNGGNGFAGWYQQSGADDMMALNFSPAMKNVEQYMLVTKYDNEYYIVLNDGKLEKVEDGLSGNPVGGEFTTPMTWTWDGSHLYHNSLATGYTDDQRASDFYRRYIDPASATGLTQEYGKYEDGTYVEGAPTENPTVLVTVRGNKGQYTNKMVINRLDAMMSTSFDTTANGASFKIHKTDRYLGVTKSEDGTLHITGSNGQDGAADFWFAEPNRVTGESYLMMTLDDYPVNGEQYFLVAKRGEDYYIVNADRSLSAKHIAKDNDRLTFINPEKPQLWTFTGDYENSQITCTVDGQTLYLNPYDGGISTQRASNNSDSKLGIKIDSNYDDNTRQLRGYNPTFFYIDDSNQLRGTGNINTKNMQLHLARLFQVNEMDYYDSWGGYAERNHMVNHIDISIEGKTEVEVPLIYGTYLYRNPNQSDPDADDYFKTFTVSKSTDITLAQKVKITEDDIKRGTVEAFVRRTDGNGNEYYDYRPDLFTITGYSANEKTDYSTDQVRIEGNFKVADIPPVEDYKKDWDDTRRDRYNNRVYYTVSVNKPVTFQYIDPYMGQIYIYGDNGEIVPLEVTMDINFSASFNYWDWYGEGKQHNNECPPIQPPKPDIPSDATDAEKAQKWGEFWAGNQFYKWHGNDQQVPRASLDLNDSSAPRLYRKQDPNASWVYYYSFTPGDGYQEYTIDARPCGGIAGYGNSGMDFVLGGDAGDAEANVVALNITKKIVDEKGDPISLAEPVNNDFKVYYNSNGDPCDVDGKAWRVGDEGPVTNPITDSDSIYNGYKYLHTKSIQVGASGMGLIYDYSVHPGMFYIQEDKDKLATTVVDTKGQTWEYSKTYIETEYVWRNSSDTDEKRHVSNTYTDKVGDYKSVPEVLGQYHRKVNGTDVGTDDEQKPLRNGFLVYHVYNVYKSKPINVEVEKKWQFGDEVTEPLANATMTVTLGRYKLTKDPNYTPKGTLRIVDSYEGIQNDYEASYTVLGPNGFTRTLNYSSESDNMKLTDLWAGEYTVVKIVHVKDNYLIDPLQETRFVTIPENAEGTVTFNTTHYQRVDSSDDIIKVGVAVGYPDGSFRVNRNPYNTKNVLAVHKNSTVQFSFDDFQYSDWQLQNDVKWSVYQWDETDQNDIAWKTTDELKELAAPHGQLQNISVGDKDVCILILFHDENIAPAMNIRLQAASSVQADSLPGEGQIAGLAPSMSQNDIQGTPTSPIEGMMYVRDQENGSDWVRTIELSQALGWTRVFNENGTPIDFEEYDPDGYKYVYFIANVTEQNIPNGTEIQFDRDYTRELIKGDENTHDKIKYTFTITNRMPDKAKVRIKKVSELNPQTLLSAAFELQKRNEDGSYSKVRDINVTNGYSDMDGIELGFGHYRLIETTTPEGYVQLGADPEFDVGVSTTGTGEIVVNYKGETLTGDIKELTVTNTPLGALKISKAVEVNGHSPTDTQKALTDGTYTFKVTDANDTEITGSPFSITYSGGVVTSPSVGYVLVGDLVPGVYTIEETGFGNLTFKSVTGGNNDADNKRIKVTVAKGDTTASTASAQVIYTNNKEVVDVEAGKIWTNNGTDVTAELKNASVIFTLQSRSKTGENTWSDWKNASGVTAEANGNDPIVELKTTDEASSDLSAWKVTWVNLPKYDDQNCLIQYQVLESEAKIGTDNIQLPQGASVIAQSYDTVDGHANPTAQVSLTNPLPTTEVTVKKTWSNTTNWLDSHIQVGMTLKADGNVPDNLPAYPPNVSGADPLQQEALVWLTAADAVNGYTWHNLPVYTAAGSKIDYSVAETGMKYKPDNGNAIDITNWANAFTTQTGTLSNGTLTIDNSPNMTAIKVTKLWTLNNVARTDKTEISYALYKKGATDTVLNLNDYQISVDKGEDIKETGKLKYVSNDGWQTVTISGLPGYELVFGGESGQPTTASYAQVEYYVAETGEMGNTVVTYGAVPDNPGAGAGDEQAVASNAAINGGKITIYNRDANVDVNVLKVDAAEHSRVLKDAEFQILKYKDENDKYVAYDYANNAFLTVTAGDANTQTAEDRSKKTTDGEGRLSFTGLLAGRYKLVETQTPPGYIKVDNNDIYFTVSADGEIVWTTADGERITDKTAAADKPNQVDYESTTFTVGNTAGAALPNTGGHGTGLFYLLGMIMLFLAGAGWVVMKGKHSLLGVSR